MSSNRKQHLVSQINLLAGSLYLVDEVLRQEFIKAPGKAIRRYNAEFAPLYRQRRIELSEEELGILCQFAGETVEEFLGYLVQLVRS